MGAPVSIRPARPEDEDRLREIAGASKSYWGYEPERVNQWAAGIDLFLEGPRSRELYVAEAAGRAIAWAALIPKGDVVWLEDMWVEPDWIGKGVGSLLFGHCRECATALGGTSMEWEAEPNAVGFYERVGGRYLRDSEPTEWGRVVPVMGVDLGG
jgi:GNAT superfamily N-acetyltransferase